MFTREDNELICRTGPGTPMGDLFRRFWLPLTVSSALPEPDCPPIRAKLLGESLIAFRDSSGKVGVIDRNCPHRLADLFFGRNEEHGLRCSYHGWKFDVAGNCVDMPTETPESTFRQKVRVKSYPAQDHGGVIWVYMGPSYLRPELPEFEWALVPETHRLVTCWLQDSNYLQAVEGDFDSAHVSFAHRWFNQQSIPAVRRVPRRLAGAGDALTNLDTAPKLTVKETEYGFVYGSRRVAPEGQYYWRVSQFLLPVWSLIPGPNWPRTGHAWFPVDDEHCMAFQYSCNPEEPLTEDQIARLKASPDHPYWTAHELRDGTIIDTWYPRRHRLNDYLIDRALQRTATYTGIASGREQDMALTDGMGRIPERWREHLGTTDIAIIALRRLLIRLARQLQAGREPAAAHNGAAYRVRPIDILSDIHDFGTLYDKHADLAVAGT